MLFKACCCTRILERAVEMLTLSTVNAVIKAKIVHRLLTVLLKPNCHQSERARDLARERRQHQQECILLSIFR